jgi:hypothetical protein
MSEDINLSFKGHFNDAEYWKGLHLFPGLIGTVFSALAAALIFAEQWIINPAYISLLTTGVIGILTFLNCEGLPGLGNM